MNKGDRFRDCLYREILSWNVGIRALTEKPVGYRFVNKSRILDIVLQYEGKYLGIEAKLQETEGTTYQKISYSLDDCLASPIPTILVFAGSGIAMDMKAKLIASGKGIEVDFKPDRLDPQKDTIQDSDSLFQQRVYIELGLDWFSLFPSNP